MLLITPALLDVSVILKQLLYFCTKKRKGKIKELLMESLSFRGTMLLSECYVSY